jgi:dienelactone hydrolase
MPSFARSRVSFTRLCWIAAFALALFVAAMSLVPAGDTAGGPAVLSSANAGPWQIVAMRRADGANECSARRALGGTGIDRPHTIEFMRAPGHQTLRLTADAWTLPRDAVMSVTLAAGPRVRGRSEAILSSPTQLSVALGDVLTTLERLADVPAIEVRVTGQTLTVPLSDIAVMRAALERCVVEQVGAEFGPLTVELPVSPPDADLVEERRFLTVRIGGEDYRLDTLVVRPAGVSGRLPIALIGHGQGSASETSVLSTAHLQRQARDLAYRGYLAVAVIRRGFGQSDGVPGRPGGGAYGPCGTHGESLIDASADDLAATLAVIAERPDADADRVVLFGQSAAGPAVLALAARGLPGLRAVVLISGGLNCWNGNEQADVHATPQWLASLLTSYGARITVPSLWIYAANDRLFPEPTARAMHAIYAGAGAPAQLVMLPATGEDGHHIFSDLTGRSRWLFSLDLFLRRHDLPTWREDLTDRVVQQAGIAPDHRWRVMMFLSFVTPRVLVVDRATGRPYVGAAGASLQQARDFAIKLCREDGGTEASCVPVMENFRWLAVAADHRADAAVH